MRTITRFVVAAVFLAGCSDAGSKGTPTDPGGGTPTTPAIASVEVGTSAATIVVGQTIQLAAKARAADGTDIAVAAFSWYSDRTAVATVDASTGSVTAVAAGSATISASAGGKTGSAVVRVEATPASPVAGIAYVRGSEIHLIAADGTGDRLLWSSPAGPPVSSLLTPVHGLIWRPDGTEIAFASDHEQAYSWFQHDIYALRADGTGLRRLTNPPARADLASLPATTVKLTVTNSTLSYGTFIVYMMGASGPATVTLGPGDAEMVTFQRVADLGPVAQPIVAMLGGKRWFGDRAPDIQAGQTFDAGLLRITGLGYSSDFGAGAPAWRSDGSNVAFVLSPWCTIRYVADRPVNGPSMDELIDANAFTGFCAYDRGPTPATANKLLVTTRTENITSIYLVAEGASSPGTPIVSLDDYNFIEDIRWLPDGSGFLVAMRDGLMDDDVNLYEYDFPAGPLRQLTDFRVSDEHLRSFSISPDGRQIVYEWRTTSMFADGPRDLYIINRDGSGRRLLVRNAEFPAWSPVTR